MLPNRPLGRTGLTVSAIGLGGAFLDAHGVDAGVATVRRALDRGVTYFDTSPMYCGGRSQEVLGAALAGRGEAIVLATKLGYLPTRAAFRDEAALRAQLTDNLRRLGRRRVDVLQAHEADLAPWWSDDAALTGRIPADRAFDFADAPVMHVLRAARREGLCTAIGITGNGLEEMTRLLAALDVDTFLLAFHYDLLHRGARREALPLAQRKGVAAILGGVLQCGRLAEVRPEWLEPDSAAGPRPAWLTEPLREAYRRLDALRRDSGLSLVELTVRFLLADHRPSTVLLGASTPAEVDEAADAAEAGPLPPDLHAAVEALAEP